MAFIIWMVMGLVFVGMGIYEYFSKRETAFGFWANAGTLPIADVKAYNRAMGKLWFVFGVVFILLGLPLLAGQNSPYILLSTIGVLLEAIAAMIVYVLKIEGKYKKK